MSKLAVISDLHVDINRLTTEDLAVIGAYLQEQGVSHLHLAGDMANKVERALAVVDFFQSYFPTTFNWGNHEMADLKESEIEVFNHPAFLNQDYRMLSETTALVGYNGWYDYLFSDEMDTVKIRQTKELFWYDRVIPRTAPDPEINHQLLKKLKFLLDDLQKRDLKVILATHFVPKREFIVYQTRSEFKRWNQLNAFLGSAEMGDLLDEYDNVSQVVFGHTHRRFNDLTLNGTRYSCKPLGYYYEWQLTREFVMDHQLMTRFNPGKLRGILKQQAPTYDPYRKAHFLEEVKQAITFIEYI